MLKTLMIILTVLLVIGPSVFHQSSNAQQSKSTFKDTTNTSPALANYNGHLWMAWKGSSDSYLNVMDISNPSSKKTFKDTTNTSPALANYNGHLWMAWKGSSDRYINVMDISNLSSTSDELLNSTDDNSNNSPFMK